MILVGNSRGGGQDLARHLLKEENDHVEVHELRGFAASDLHGAFKEAHALSRATKAKKYLFSLSLNPPENEHVGTEEFESAIVRVEKELGLTDQPRAIVFHEKEGRRHCHAVWSRVNGEALKVIPMDFHKNKLHALARELYLEHGWQMPRGFLNEEPSDPKNFTLEEWQQAKRRGQDARQIKAVLQESWAISDSRASFTHALKEQGLILARGDRRGFVAVDRHGEPYAIARWVGVKTKAVREKLGEAGDLPSIEEAMSLHAKEMKPAFDRWSGELTDRAATLKTVQAKQREALIAKQRQERAALQEKLEQRRIEEAKARQARFRKGLRGLWDRLRGEHRTITKQNERETLACEKRDRKEKDRLVFAHLSERRALKDRQREQIEALKTQRQSLRDDWTHYREMRDTAPARASPPRKRGGPDFER
ncbi:relaxase/mobilization nuclease domain-containing protein [Parvularcula flava]|uniref:Relaxase/mobilization nuclease domain-containing protein n=1 Tax=Aquisalinus luteolus TaxID=1566827 RepID=A0A8J3AA03_9PROT|nr:relaxase/mobilization nuclease domain-containing protein [Aquisalinus luteolus]NHK29679.1 relaxase/mobilization nuclease domain-containing protein [Aquisalinus luteolus]GGI02129.1 hypothetical protein GCM10011355_34400 [Aquisalinus luteolus]